MPHPDKHDNHNSHDNHHSAAGPTSEAAARLAALQAMLGQQEVDAILVTRAANRRYLTDFTGSAGLLLVLPDAAHLLADSRYYTQIEHQSPHVRLERVGYEALPRLGEILAERGARRLGFEAHVVTVSQLEEFREKVSGVEWTSKPGLVEQLRAVKSASEVEAIRRAIAVSDAAMAHAYVTARPGMTEAELAWALEVFMRERGAEGMAFEIIVGAGENGALPHHRAGSRAIRAGEPIVVDMGAIVDGYHSDITRTFSIGPVGDPEYARVYAAVDEANRAAIAGLAAGMTGPDADALGREVIKAAGYGDYFGHSLGHGVGLDVHEGPRLSVHAGDQPLATGMVCTVEPGVYLPGRFGVRIEDIVLIEAQGVRVLTGAPKLAPLVPA